MLRKTILALAALGALGTAALTPTTAGATWYGHDWYGYHQPYGYGWHYGHPYGLYGGKRFFYGGKLGYRNYGWRRGYGYY